MKLTKITQGLYLIKYRNGNKQFTTTLTTAFNLLSIDSFNPTRKLPVTHLPSEFVLSKWFSTNTVHFDTQKATGDLLHSIIV